MSQTSLRTSCLVYGLLGPLEVRDAQGGTLRIPPGRQQTVLGALLLEANRVVSVDRLIDIVWEDEPPRTARTQIQICVSQLRAGLDRARGEETIQTQAPGYRLRVADHQLDLTAFTAARAAADAAVARCDDLEASRLLGEALALWRGPALSGTASRVLQTAAAQLDEARLSAREALADVGLRLGRHHALIGELTLLVDEHPLRERLRGQLMLALYRSGRQSEALEVYRRGRETLVEELGLDPGSDLQELESAILSADPRLLLPDSSSAPPAPKDDDPARAALAPFQLPRDIADFTGRTREIEEIGALLSADGGTATRIVVLSGAAGAGKSALAVHVAHQLAESAFPDGQLYRDLGASGAAPATAEDVLGRFLRALGVPGEAVPETLDERAELYRQSLAGRRALVILDDAVDGRDLNALLPGSSSSAVLVTSRSRLAGLAGARVIEVEAFDAAQAVAMLREVIGRDRVEAEPEAARALVRLVGGLPLALRIVAARLAARRHWSLGWMLERLSDERRRLDELAHGEMMVRASLAMTYDGLDPDARRLLRLLSLIDGPAFPTWTAAALLDMDVYGAGDLLEQLVDTQMLEISGIDADSSPRYRFHGLIKLFARERLEHEDADEDRRAAVERLTGGWLALTAEAHRRLYGGDFTVLHGTGTRWPLPERHTQGLLADPLRWLEAEHGHLVSAVSAAAAAELPETCWDLAVSLVTLFEARCYFDDWERTHDIALEAVRRAGLRRGEAALQCSLGSLHLSRSRLPQARARLEPAAAAFEELGDLHGLALARRNLALLDHIGGDVAAAAELYGQALEGFRAHGDLTGQAHVLGQLGHIALVHGDEDEAGRRIKAALEVCRAAGGGRIEVQLRYRLGELLLRQGRLEEAQATLGELLERVRAVQDINGRARIAHRLGVVEHRLGRTEAARERLLEALECHERLRDERTGAQARLDLAEVLVELGDRHQAARHLGRALPSFEEFGMTGAAGRARELLRTVGPV
ncbi:SARP family transcriptional regulator [Streptomyces calvus]|uniref:SARP family transcriptional regulator n=1 Tax=Streptomyces calvus TaxID=67282 RepID=A0A514JYX3_9ACTN|nr:BTAD domain-containing putative transcriptional regulator [Streptomyces calvus]QDI72555.1 SARP family transcriptional regulator [Streptomyces calvus]